ncbi:hypothetical protein BpHYR1_020277 [Brachionus plicatilis]|uniref:Uncharacterized protein n=1 Tax=Brachionus plicatilis TaxID=10195 RepID=A0A3M7RYJ0_BRAPC|nr:hypothetical protein BpHYR1_020277 [Brachionus plicatilis]
MSQLAAPLASSTPDVEQEQPNDKNSLEYFASEDNELFGSLMLFNKFILQYSGDFITVFYEKLLEKSCSVVFSSYKKETNNLNLKVYGNRIILSNKKWGLNQNTLGTY